jgi:TolB protein
MGDPLKNRWSGNRRSISFWFRVFAVIWLVQNGATRAQDFKPLNMIKRVTNVIDSYPMPSLDGEKIIFQSNRSGDWEIYIMNKDGSGIRNLTQSNGPDVTPNWAINGKQIVFASERDNDSEIYIMDADGANQKRLTSTPGDDSHPHFFPDGSRIIFNSARSSSDVKADWGKQYHEIFSMRPDGSDVKQITNFKTVSTYPSVSPDGKKIAFRKVIDGYAFNWDLTLNANNRNSEVFVMDINGDAKSAINLSKSPAFDGWPWWSPDSKKIAFSSNRNGPANVGQLFIVNLNDSTITQLTDVPSSFAQPNWTSDGKSIYAYQCWETSDFEYGNIVLIKIGN